MAALVPFLVGYSKDDALIAFLAGLSGVLISIIAASLLLYKFKDHWLTYRSTSETSKHELFLFRGAAGPYKGHQDLETLVGRVEGIMQNENLKWVDFASKDDIKSKTVS